MEATSSRFTFQPIMIAPNSTPPPMARSAASPDLPPGFRFHPTDEELIVHYLRNQATSQPCPVSIISELNIYKFDPWELPGKTEYAGEEEWYFFSPRDRKYPNGARPNRATASGYWKATGTDKAIYSGSRYVGVKKALVFYKGRPPKGVKSDWVMHEYRLSGAASSGSAKPKGSIRLDDWVLCRIYQKKQQKKAVDDDRSDGMVASTSMEGDKGAVVDQDSGETPRFPRSCSLAHLLEAEYISLGEMLNDYPAGPGDEFHAIANEFGSVSGEHVDMVSQFLVDDVEGEAGGGTEERIGSSQFGIPLRGAAVHSVFQYF